MDKRILVFDPGESTGWVGRNMSRKDCMTGGTIKHDREQIWGLLNIYRPEILIFEIFQLYATHAKSLIGNKFYTCEIIGLFKLYADMCPEVQLIAQPAANKKYSGARSTDTDWLEIKSTGYNVTEHTYDAYMHWCYYKRSQRSVSSP